MYVPAGVVLFCTRKRQELCSRCDVLGEQFRKDTEPHERAKTHKTNPANISCELQEVYPVWPQKAK